MTTHTVTTLKSPPGGGNSSLVFHIPAPTHQPRQFLERYTSLRSERGMGNNHGDEASTRLALEVYEEEGMRAEREQWILEAKETFTEAVKANKATLRHVELILPVSGMATPLNLFSSLRNITHLESLCVQWPYQGYHPMHILFLNSGPLQVTICPSFSTFQVDLMNMLAVHAATLKRLRISLPEPLREPWVRLRLDVSALPPLPLLELLDLSYWSPTGPDIKALLRTDGPVPNLHHLIIDCGAEIAMTDFDDHDEEVPPDYDWKNPPPEIEERSWPALGACLAGRQPPLHSLNAARHEKRYPQYPFGSRFRCNSLREVLSEGAGEQEGTSLANLAVCTAQPIQYRSVEPGADGAEEDDKDLFEHSPGCGHLAYPADQRPTTGLWK
ncbi:hypothetical protein C8R46DRAFT_1227240 [Mycena filopes]|nr:hypothetical protein C8R46DRAFT_1227240 [Mycena filopes]